MYICACMAARAAAVSARPARRRLAARLRRAAAPRGHARATMLCYRVYYTILYYTIPYHTILYYTIL